ncbi:MAG: GNAT family acetyltransferase [Rhizobiales bacterium]|nr:GNAT family acetyltransferase [Hyphomicrobiales bacterium]
MMFRDMEDRDVEAVAALWRDCGLTREWNDPYKDIAFARRGETSTILVGEAQGRIAASVMAGHDGHRGVLYYVAVEPALRGKGFGKEAVRAAESWIRARGVWKINLLVRSENAAVRGFYEKLGYEMSPVTCMARRLDGAK